MGNSSSRMSRCFVHCSFVMNFPPALGLFNTDTEHFELIQSVIKIPSPRMAVAREEWHHPCEHPARTSIHPHSLLCANIYLVLTVLCCQPLSDLSGCTLDPDADQHLFLLVTSLWHSWMNYVAIKRTQKPPNNRDSTVGDCRKWEEISHVRDAKNLEWVGKLKEL